MSFAMILRNIKDYFSELDRATGDGDHGVTMSIGWTAVREKLDTLSDDLTFDKICMQVASSFLSAVGASAGPLYATALMRGGAKLKICNLQIHLRLLIFLKLQQMVSKKEERQN